MRSMPAFQSCFELFNNKGITFQVIYGQRRGQHISHQTIQDTAKTDWVWRIDDDEIPEPNVLKILTSGVDKRVGAIGGLVLLPGAPEVPPNASNRIDNLSLPNLQWFTYPMDVTMNVDHLHSTFLYRRGFEKFNPYLSPAAHREETLFTYGLKRQGFRVLVDTEAITWHFRNGQGGIRSHNNPQFWEDDDRIFREQLNEWGVNGFQPKPIVLDCGKGDHVIVKSLLPELKRKYKKLILATCYPDVFEGEEQISIADARMRFGNLDRFNVYRFLIDEHWTGSLQSAYRRLFQLEDSSGSIRAAAPAQEPAVPKRLPILEGAYANAF
jgi:hypothetical protein